MACRETPQTQAGFRSATAGGWIDRTGKLIALSEYWRCTATRVASEWLTGVEPPGRVRGAAVARFGELTMMRLLASPKRRAGYSGAAGGFGDVVVSW